MANTKVTTDVIADDAITTAKIADDAITAAKIADDVINSEHYAAASIDNEHLADDAVDSAELAAGAVDLAHMSANSIDSDQYVDGSIDTAHLADDQVTLAKMAGITRGSIIIGNSSGNPAALAIGTNDYVLTSDGTDIAWEVSAVEESPAFTGNVTVGGTLGVTGVTTLATHLVMGDNDIIKLGAGTDLQIYHNGTHSIIDNSTGNLRILADIFEVNSQDNSESTMLGIKNGAVSFYYDNSLRLATVSGGIKVQGETATAITIFADSGSSQGSGTITFNTDGASADQSVAAIKMSQGSGDGASRKGQFEFQVSDNGAPSTVLTIANNGNVGINDTTPDYTLDVEGDINFTGTLREDGTEFSGGISMGKAIAAAMVFG